jgi:hypothetical protein
MDGSLCHFSEATAPTTAAVGTHADTTPSPANTTLPDNLKGKVAALAGGVSGMFGGKNLGAGGSSSSASGSTDAVANPFVQKSFCGALRSRINLLFEDHVDSPF